MHMPVSVRESVHMPLVADLRIGSHPTGRAPLVPMAVSDAEVRTETIGMGSVGAANVK